MFGRIEAYLYGSGTAGLRDATADLIIEEFGGATATLPLPGSLRLTSALVAWETAANASAALANTYTITWNDATQTVRIARVGAGPDFRPQFGGNLAAIWGYSDPASLALASAHVGDTPSLARVDTVRVGTAALQSGDRVDLRQYRHGRSEALCFGNHDVADIRMLVPRADRDRLEGSYCVAGRVRVYQSSSLALPYGPTYPQGYLDGYVLSAGEVRSGSSEEWSEILLRLGVPRA